MFPFYNDLHLLLSALAISLVAAAANPRPELLQPITGNASSLREDPNLLMRRDGQKYVFMHHIVGNTYPYNYNDWVDDFRQIGAKGVGAVALNIGRSDWQRNQIKMAYDAAASTGVKAFFSFDFTEMDCNVNDFVDRVNQFANHAAQFKVDGRPMISSFSGDCLGNEGWDQLRSRTNGFLMPFIWGQEGKFSSWPSLDSWLCWGCAWPQGNREKNIDDDRYYEGQLGKRFATTVSNWFFAHFNYKNTYMRGDDWLAVKRWEQLMSMRDQLQFVEIVSWNDYGESNYYGPVKGAQPDGTTWATGFPHVALWDMTEYYIKAFKTGNYPPINQDKIYFWARPHPHNAAASGDNLSKPDGWDWTEDSMWVAVFSTGTATVTLRCGDVAQDFTVGPGVTKLKSPLNAGSGGKMTVQMKRNGKTIINHTPQDYTFNTNPRTYNYNTWSGSATSTA